MARLPYVEPESMKAEVREVYDRLPAKLNIFRMMAHAETCFRPLIGLGTSILARQKLSPKLRELAILRVASLSRAAYEWTQHVAIAIAVGVSEAQVKALEEGDVAASCFDDEEKLVLRFTTECLRDVKVSDATFAAAAKRWSHQEVVELLLTSGYYMMIARLLESTAVDLEPALRR
ncbi:MAG: carboxymuconolactone decarboxylase family protein [Candidatus Binatia bacterium]